MTTSLSTQLHRSLFALPLLVVGLFGAASIDAAAEPQVAVAAGAAPTVAVVTQLDCGPTPTPAGALALARMPGDLGPLAARVRCAS